MNLVKKENSLLKLFFLTNLKLNPGVERLRVLLALLVGSEPLPPPGKRRTGRPVHPLVVGELGEPQTEPTF